MNVWNVLPCINETVDLYTKLSAQWISCKKYECKTNLWKGTTDATYVHQRLERWGKKKGWTQL